MVGRADREWQEAVTAVVALRNGVDASPDELRSHCAEALASYKVPTAIEFRDDRPKSAALKTLRRVLRDEVVADA